MGAGRMPSTGPRTGHKRPSNRRWPETFRERKKMKKVINAPERVVEEMCRGMELAHPGLLRLIPEYNVLVRADAPVQNKVALVSGGGSGHEPTHGGYVGPGMLDAACAGAVFTSPTPEQMLEATKAVDGGAGVFYDVKNLAGVKEIAERVNVNMRSMGMALTSCIPPESGEPIFEIGDDEMEIGMGIHGEPGTERKEIEPADRIVDELLEKILGDSVDFTQGDVAVMVNGLGGTPLMELYVAYAHVADALEREGVNVYKMAYVGEYMTSLEMAGFSVSLLKLDEDMKGYLEAPCDVAAGRPF